MFSLAIGIHGLEVSAKGCGGDGRESLISPPFFFLATQRDCIPRPHRDRSGCMTQFNGMRVKIMCMVFAPEKPLVQLY